MNQQTKQLYEAVIDAAKKVVDRNYPIAQIYVNLDNLREALTAYEQSETSSRQQENDMGTIQQKARQYITSEYGGKWIDKIFQWWSDDVIEALSDFASQQTADKDREIAELEDALLDIIQVNEWKEKYGEDERYLQALPVALKNAKKLIQK